MNTLAVIGAQWGDEGKGKITDLLAEKSDWVVRYQGGNNAGHTIIVGQQKIVLHLIPSGILHPHCKSVIAHGVVVDPDALWQEIQSVQQVIAVTPERLFVSNRSPVITCYHKLLDQAREQGIHHKKIGTTGRGIGPCYEDKYARRSIWMQDLLYKDVLRQKLAASYHEKKTLLEHLYDRKDVPTLEAEVERLHQWGVVLAPYITETYLLLQQAQGQKILYEGAQGVLLDIDYGTYPFVTSSSTSAGGIALGAGVPGGHVQEVLGVAKAYQTRVGEGPFPTELSDECGHTLQKVGQEFGATTGRSRRCGWLDLPLLRYACRVSQCTSLAFTKLDILCHLPQVEVCHAYEYRGNVVQDVFPGMDLAQVNPIYRSFATAPTLFNETGNLVPVWKDYIDYVEKMVGIPIGIMAFGPERSQIVWRRDYFQA